MAGRANGRAVCLFLALISSLVCFAPSNARAQQVVGTISQLSGSVQIQRGGATLGSASVVGVDLGDRILTGAAGHVVIVLNDQSRMEISPSSNITLDQFTVTGGTPSTRTVASSRMLPVDKLV